MRKIASSIFPYIFPRLQDAIFVGALIAVVSQGFFLLNGDGDLGRHLTIGNYILDNLKIPTQDLFSHTMQGKPLVPHEWLAEVGFSLVNGLMGLDGVVLLIALLIATTFTLAYREMLRRNVSRLVAIAVTGLAGYASSLHWLARPHIFTFLFIAVWAYLLENEKSRLWLFPLIMLLWANTHGAFIAGFVILAGHVTGWLWESIQKQATRERGQRLLVIGVTSLAVTFLNPAGWRLWGTSVGYLGNRFLVDQTIEYQSPNFHNWSTWPFLIMLMIGILALAFGGRLRPHESILFAAWMAMSLYSARNIPLFVIVVAPYLGALIQIFIGKILILQQIEQKLFSVEHNLRGAVFPITTVILLVLTSFIQTNTTNRFDSNKFPVMAADWLQDNPQDGRMFNNFIWGGYLLYRLWPQQNVFIDGQTDFYGEALTREYAQVMALREGWQAVLKKYDVAWVIVQSDKPLVGALQDTLHWPILYQDPTATILHRP
jgi:hypothetical protein